MFTVTHTPSGAAGSLLALGEPRENETRLCSLLCCFRKTRGGKRGERDGGNDGVEEKTVSASVRSVEEILEESLRYQMKKSNALESYH